jgi:K+/H+ antiporter YhaU regulatory subunit KhtT
VRRPDGEIVFNPAPEFRLSEGDSVILMGEQRSLRDLESALMKAFPAG